MLLAGYEPNIVQRTALAYTSLSGVTRESLNTAIERMRANNNAATVKDVTAPNIQKKLAKMFGEVSTASSTAAPSTGPWCGTGELADRDAQMFGSMPIGQYLPEEK